MKANHPLSLQQTVPARYQVKGLRTKVSTAHSFYSNAQSKPPQDPKCISSFLCLYYASAKIQQNRDTTKGITFFFGIHRSAGSHYRSTRVQYINLERRELQIKALTHLQQKYDKCISKLFETSLTNIGIFSGVHPSLTMESGKCHEMTSSLRDKCLPSIVIIKDSYFCYFSLRFVNFLDNNLRCYFRCILHTPPRRLVEERRRGHIGGITEIHQSLTGCSRWRSRSAFA